MGYTGNLLRLSQAPDALKLSGPSPRHAVVEGAPEIQREQQSVPRGTGAEFAGSDFDKVVMAGHGMALDVQPVAAGTPPGSGETEAPWHIDYTRGSPYTSTAILSARAAAAAHGGAGDPSQNWGADNAAWGRAHDGSRDRGWIRSIFWPEPMFLASQDRQELNPDGPPSSVAQPEGVGGAKYGRGINSLAQNNPQGWRNGRYRFNTWPNTVFAHISRVIGTQMLQPRDIYAPGAQQRMVTSMVTPPSLPRDAPNPDDVQTANSSYTSANSSVFGGF